MSAWLYGAMRLDKKEFLWKLSLFRIYRGALWILGEYCSTKEDIQSVMTEVRRSLGEVCIVTTLTSPGNPKRESSNKHLCPIWTDSHCRK